MTLVNIRDIKNKEKTYQQAHADTLLGFAHAPVEVATGVQLKKMAEFAEKRMVVATVGEPEHIGYQVIPVPSPSIAQYINMPAIKISSFGNDAVTAVAQCGDAVTDKMKMCDVPDFQKKVVDILTVAKGVRVPKDGEKQSRWDKLVNKAKFTREQLISDFSTVDQQITGMMTVIGTHQGKLVTANSDLDIIYDNNLKDYENLTKYIDIGEQVIEYKKQELTAMRAVEPMNMLLSQRIADLTALINRWELRLDKLNKLQMVAIQTAPSIRTMQDNNLKLTDTFDDLSTITIPSWKKFFQMQINVQDQQKANLLANTINDATNDFMVETSKLLNTTSVEIARTSQRGSIYIETLEQVQGNLVDMFTSIKEINEQGERDRADAKKRMDAMKQVYLQMAKDGLS